MTLARREPDSKLYRPKEGVQVSRATMQAAMQANLPVVRVAQDQSGGGTPGNYYAISTGEQWETLEGTPLAIREGHIKWVFPFQGSGQGPECWSTDTVVGAPGAKYAGRFCSRCEWLLNGCTPNFAVVFLLLPERRQVLLTLTRGMSRAVGELLQAEAVRARHVRLMTRKIRGRLGSWYTVEVDRDMPTLDPAVQIEVESYFRSRYVIGADLPEEIATENPPAPHHVNPVTGEIPSGPVNNSDAGIPEAEAEAEDWIGDHDNLPF